MDRKQRNLLLGLLLALLVLLGCLFLVQSSRDQAKKASEAAAATDTVSIGDETVTGVDWYNGTATYSFALNESDNWYWTLKPEFPLNSAALVRLVSAAQSLQPDRRRQAPPPLHHSPPPCRHLSSRKQPIPPPRSRCSKPSCNTPCKRWACRQRRSPPRLSSRRELHPQTQRPPTPPRQQSQRLPPLR